MDHKTLFAVGVLAATGIVVICLVMKKRNEGYLVEVNMPTSPEVEYIEGQPNRHVIRLPDGGEMIRPKDIALSPGFGVGEGTFGFGRFGSSFMA